MYEKRLFALFGGGERAEYTVPAKGLFAQLISFGPLLPRVPLRGQSIVSAGLTAC